MTATDTTDQANIGVAARAKLAEIISQVQCKEDRLSALNEARNRSREQLRQSTHQLTERKTALNSAITKNREHLAYAYLNNDLLDDPVLEAKARVEVAEQEADRFSEIETSLSDEIRRVQTNLRDLKMRLYTAMSDVVVASPEYRGLVDAHKQAWQQIRTGKIALRSVAHSLHGSLPDQYSNLSEISEPTESTAIGFQYNKAFVERWSTALAHLETFADAELPQT